MMIPQKNISFGTVILKRLLLAIFPGVTGLNGVMSVRKIEFIRVYKLDKTYETIRSFVASNPNISPELMWT